MNTARYLFVCTFALAAGASAIGQIQSGSPVDPASWVPADALMYVGIADIKEFSDDFRRTAFYKLMQDPGARESCGQVSLILKVYEELKDRLARSLDTEPADLKNPFGGPMALYVTATRDEPTGAVEAVFVAGIGDTGLMKDYHARAIRKLHQVADEHETISFGPHTIDRFTSAVRAVEADEEAAFEDLGLAAFSEDEGKLGRATDEVFGKLFSANAMPEKLAVCLTEGRLIVALMPQRVIEVLQREQAGNTLADTEAHRTLVREFQPLGAVRLLANLPRLFVRMAAAGGTEAREALAMLGAESLGDLIGHVRYDGAEFESRLEALLLLRGAPAGLSKILSMKNRPVIPPANVSADNVVYASLNVDLTEILDEVERMVRRADPEAADQMRAGMEVLELPDGQKLNLREEVLENLHGPLTFTMGFERPYGPQSARILLMLGQRDKEVMICALDKLSDLWPGMMIKREVGAAIAYDLPLVGCSLAPIDGPLIAGTPDAVDAALQGPQAERRLSTAPRFRRAAALAPREAWGVAYVDSRRMFEAALETSMHKGAPSTAPFASPANLIALEIAKMFTIGIDEHRIDAARQLSRHMAPTIITLATTPNGIRLTWIDLVPEGE